MTERIREDGGNDANTTTTRLLTLLNVSAVKTGKRKRTFDNSLPVQKLNKRKSVLFADVSSDMQSPVPSNVDAGNEIIMEPVEVLVEEKELLEDNESQCTSISTTSCAVCAVTLYSCP